jgi:SAM-dependent methyltransferase
MAEVLRSRFPEITIHVSGFEECSVGSDAFALVTAAQSWHWVDPDAGAAKAADVLRPGGWIALFWNTPKLEASAWHDELQPIYERIAPATTHDRLHARNGSAVRDHIDKLVSSERFGPTVSRHVPWTQRYSTEAYVALLGTHSDHRLLPDAQRTELHDAIADAINARGGEIEHPYVTDLIAAPVR